VLGSDESAPGDRSEIATIALARAQTVISRRSNPHDRSEMRWIALEGALNRISRRSRARGHDQVDAMGVLSRSQTRGVDLIIKALAWRPVPDTPAPDADRIAIGPHW
jgi:hypothetical protein